MRLFLSLGFFTAFLPISYAQETPLPSVPDGFKIELLLQAPDVEAPTALAVSPNGDLFYAEDPMDMRGPATRNIDKIWLLQGGDPKKKILIADQMWAVMGMEFVDNKLYVVHPPHVTIFTLDANGKVTKREELFDDLGPKIAGLPGFNDHICSGIHLGMDGWLYVSIGDKGIPSMSRIPIHLRNSPEAKKISAEGSVHVAEGRWNHLASGHHISLEGGGAIRFRPDGTGLEVFASGTRNHLDVPIDELDRIFVRDNTDDGLGWWTRVMYLPRRGFLGYPWAYKKYPKETVPAITDFGGGSPCGGWVYQDDALPETYRGRILHAEWGQGKVFAVKVAAKGAGFAPVDQIALVDPKGSKLKDFRPFTIRPTPDGKSFYISDWAYSGWSANVKAGRLWKLTYTKEVPGTVSRPVVENLDQAFAALDHPSHLIRIQAQRFLMAHPKEFAAKLALPESRDALLKRPIALRHLIWGASALPMSERMSFYQKVALVNDPLVQRELIRSLGEILPSQFTDRKDKQFAYQVFLKALKEKKQSPLVLQQAVIASNSMINNDLLKAILDLTVDAPDPVLLHAIYGTLNQVHWQSFPEIMSSQTIYQLRYATVEAIAISCRDRFDTGAVQILESLMKHSDPAVRAIAVESLGRNYLERKLYAGTWWGTQPNRQPLPPRVNSWSGTVSVRESVLAALSDADAKVRQAAITVLTEISDPGTLEPLIKTLDKAQDQGVRLEIVRAIAGLKDPKAIATLSLQANDVKQNDSLRLIAVEGLEGIKTKSAADSLLIIAGASETPKIRGAAIRSLGRLKIKESVPFLVKALNSTDLEVKRSAVESIQALGDAKLGDSLFPLLNDPHLEIQTKVIQAMGTLKVKKSIPKLMEFATREETQFDAVKSLAQMPDRQAISAYLTGLNSKNNDLRKICSQALSNLRESAAPVLEELGKRKEIPSGALGELRKIYEVHSPIRKWNLIGPFPRDGKVYPPETELKWDATYQGFNQKVTWKKNQMGDSKFGRIDLSSFKPNEEVVVYGATTIDAENPREATLWIGSDDTFTVWVNGKKVFDIQGSRAYAPETDSVHISLQKGQNTILVRCGNVSGPWEFGMAISEETSKYTFLKGTIAKLDLEAYRRFARTKKGDVEHGKKLFMDVKGLACIKCHAVDGQGGNVGPDLAGIAVKYAKEELITSILEPSKNIANGYETIRIDTTEGKAITGVFKGETGDSISVADAEGKMITIKKEDIEKKSFSPVSTMPNGLNEGMSLQDFADLIAYLEARKEKKK